MASAEDAAAQPVAAVDQLPPGQNVSDTVIELAGWVVAAKDSQGYPFAIIDKAAAQILVFGGDGRLRGAAPGLFGSAVGDHAAPGIAGLALREIPGRDRTTPAGRFVGGFGFSQMSRKLLHLGFVQLFAVGKMRAEFLHFRFVPSFGLRKELAIQMLDLREAVWNERIEPTHRARKQIGLV